MILSIFSRYIVNQIFEGTLQSDATGTVYLPNTLKNEEMAKVSFKLEELLVKYIMNFGKESQLFFVSHSTNLLSNSLLRPDQIYSVEMDGVEGSKILRFSNEQPRVAQNLEKMYLSGVFGGIPEYENTEE